MFADAKMLFSQMITNSMTHYLNPMDVVNGKKDYLNKLNLINIAIQELTNTIGILNEESRPALHIMLESSRLEWTARIYNQYMDHYCKKVQKNPEKYLFFSNSEAASPEEFTGVVIKKEPKYQCREQKYPTSETEAGESSSLIPISEEEVEAKVQQLLKCNFPIRFKEDLTKLFRLVAQNSKSIFERSETNYPACFPVSLIRPMVNGRNLFKLFLDIFPSSNEMTLEFSGHQYFATDYKIIRLAYNLIHAQAVIRTVPNFQSPFPPAVTQPLQKAEEMYLTKLHGEENIAQVLRIFYLARTKLSHAEASSSISDTPFQVVIMEKGDGDLLTFFELLNSMSIEASDEVKINLGIKLFEIFNTLVKHGVIHNDIKPDNILYILSKSSDEYSHLEPDDFLKFISNTRLKLIDFGLADDYVPERIMLDPGGSAEWMDINVVKFIRNKERYPEEVFYDHSHDLFSFGLTFWYLCFQQQAPWSKMLKTLSAIDQVTLDLSVESYNSTYGKIAKSDTFLGRFFTNIFHPDNSKRWSAGEVLEVLKSYKHAEHPTIKEQFETFGLE